MTEISTFRSTGLLGGSSNREDDEPLPVAIQNFSATVTFKRTGLLSGSPTTHELDEDIEGEIQTLVKTDVTPNGQARSVFEPTGLLGGQIVQLENGTSPSRNMGMEENVRREGVEESRGLCDGTHLKSPKSPQLDYQDMRTSTTGPAHVSKYVPFGSVPAVTYDGKTVFLKRKPNKPKIIAASNRTKMSCLLETPVHRLMDQLAASSSFEDIIPSDPSHSPGVCDDPKLWVDRYRPSRFTDLCGDERVHRETMSWLKEWESCVFGRKRHNKTKKPATNDVNHGYEYKDEYHRPREKILLLSGPAGYGKTTLAHVAARQAGYDVMEINASDARSGQVIDERIRPTLEAGSTIGSTKPVCLVIDEIDGATGGGDNTSGFVQKLVSMTFENPRKKGRTSDKQNKNGRRPLLRPIICICNDLYASSLTKLRQYARIIRFTRPADLILTKRLRTICENEGLKAESRALSALVGVTKGDMRSCLNTLQFVKARNIDVTESVIRSATVGMKEADNSFSSILGNLFSPLARKRVKELGLDEIDESKYVSRLCRDIEDSGSIDKLASGCFEHYASLRHTDATLERHEKASDWLMTFDSFSGTMRSEREYGLLPFLSYSLIPFYPLFKQRGGPKVERPKADWENYMKTKTNEEVYKSLRDCLLSGSGQRHTGLRHLLTNEVIQLEFAPCINRIISPPLRPINSQVTRPQERALLTRLVDIMVALDLRLIQEKAEDGQLVYRLDPPIDAFITYDTKRATDVPVQRYATRHLLAGEIDAQIIKQQADTVEKSAKKKPAMFSKMRRDPDEHDDETNDNGDSHSSPARPDDVSAKKRKVAELDIADRPPVDFFGRPITVGAPQSKKTKVVAVESEKKYRASYKYNEGNSAAVRRPVKVSSLL